MKKLKIIIRSILRQRLNSGIIIISLAIGIACFNLIALFISRELNTDNFHKDRDRIFALKCDDPWVPGGKMYHCRIGSAEYMKQNFTQVEDFCRIAASGALKIFINNEEYFDKPQIIACNSNFFNFFSYKLLTNNPITALESANNIVLSSALAKKYFGDDDPLGKIISFVQSDKVEQMVVSGIFERPLENTQINFDMVRLIGERDSRCYVRLSNPAPKDDLEKLFKEKKETIPVIYSGTPGAYYLEPFNEAYFNVSRAISFERSRDITDLLIALIIGLMIIGVAAFNYLGLLTNKLTERMRDNKIRRINGASKISLIMDFMLENLIIVGISFVLSIILMQEMIPFFNKLTGSHLSEQHFLNTKQLLLMLSIVIFLMLVTLMFITYKVNSGTDTFSLMPGQNNKMNRKRIPAFNIFQMASTIGLIICSIIIIRQMDYISKKPIGLNKEVIEVRLPGQHAGKVAVFKEMLLKNSSIEKVSIVGTSPVLEHFLLLLEYDDNGTKKEYSPAGFTGDQNYLQTLGIQLMKGTDFSENITSNRNKCLINESFANFFKDQDLIGQEMPGMEDKIVIGIVKDFHYSGLKSFIEPAFISFDDRGSHLMVLPADNLTLNARDAIAGIWKELMPDYPLNIETIGDRFEWFHRENKNYIRLIGACALISIFLAMIGLFAISYQSSHSRTKEIGIHKINGARITDMIFMLNVDFIRWLIIAFIIAAPVSWYVMNKWLQNFAYKTEFKWWVYVIAGIMTLIIALLTVSWQSVRAATRNPVEALRYE